VKKILSIPEYLNSIKIDEIKFLNDKQYNREISDYLEKGFELLVFSETDNDNAFTKDLLSPKKTKFKDKKYITVNHEGKNSEKFGLEYNQEEGTFYSMSSLNFFDKNIGGELCFDKLGIGVSKPRNGIDIQGSWSAPVHSVIVGEDGDPVVSIQGDTIISKIPVTVFGNSSNWELNGHKPTSDELPDITLNHCPDAA
jgi:hypothetical protein